jgi:hypothetical protein
MVEARRGFESEAVDDAETVAELAPGGEVSETLRSCSYDTVFDIFPLDSCCGDELPICSASARRCDGVAGS